MTSRPYVRRKSYKSFYEVLTKEKVKRTKRSLREWRTLEGIAVIGKQYAGNGTINCLLKVIVTL